MSRKHAHPLRALLRADCRMLWRHGVVVLYVFLSLLYIALLRFATAQDERPRFTALLLLTDPATLSLFFMGAIVLYEKNQHIHAELYAGGVKPASYVLSKCVSSCALGTLAGCLIVWFSSPAVLTVTNGAVDWGSVLDGDLTALGVTAACMLTGGLLFACVSVVPAALSNSLNGFMMAGGLCELIFLAPAVIDLFSPLPEGFGFHPSVLLSRALRRPDLAAARLGEPMLLMQIAALLGCTVLAALLANACATRMLRGKGGAVQ